MPRYPFAQVDVFAERSLTGNPVAVVHDAAGLDEGQMAAFARWTNLSETTFLLPTTDPAADYNVRIFFPGGELPFAGHPTLGTCHAWLAAGGKPKNRDEIVQQCGVGLVRVRRDGTRLAFAAPPLKRSGPGSGRRLMVAIRPTGTTRNSASQTYGGSARKRRTPRRPSIGRERYAATPCQREAIRTSPAATSRPTPIADRW